MISVLMAAFNCEETVLEACESILRQSVQDLELVICEDGSSDATWDRLLGVAREDDRVKLLRNARNLGLPASLNKAFRASSGEFIARMDADDSCTRDRLAKLLAVLQAEADVALVGSAMRQFGAAKGLIELPVSPNWTSFIRSAPFAHATVMMRREVLSRLNGYSEDPRHSRVEDLELWFRFLSEGYTGTNLSDPLYLVREGPDRYRRRNARNRWNAAWCRWEGLGLLEAPLRFRTLAAALELAKVLVPPRIVGRVGDAIRRRATNT